MESKVIVLVTDRDDDKHGEISVLDDPKKAERLVETLLEAGFEQERIRVFNGGELDMQVSHRPVVNLHQAEAGMEAPAEAEAPVGESPRQEEQEEEEEEEEEVEVGATGDGQVSSDESATTAASSFSDDYAFLRGP